MFKHLFVPLDGSAQAERAFYAAMQLAHPTGGTVTIAQVIPSPVETTPAFAPLLPSATV